MKKKVLLLGLVIIVAIALVGAAVWWNLGFRQGADVTPVAIVSVFQDEAQTDELEQGEMLYWGEVHSGIQNMSLWINNTGSVNATLQFNYNGEQLPGDWQNYWDYTGDPLLVGETVMVTITLELPENVGVGHYEWDSGISATEAPP